MKVKITYKDGTMVEAEGTETEIKEVLSGVVLQNYFPYWYNQLIWLYNPNTVYIPNFDTVPYTPPSTTITYSTVDSGLLCTKND